MLQTVLRRAFPFQLMLAQSILWNVRPQQIRLQIQSDTPAPRQCLSTKASAMQALRKQSRKYSGNLTIIYQTAHCELDWGVQSDMRLPEGQN